MFVIYIDVFPCFAQVEALESLLDGDGDNQKAMDKRASIIPRVRLYFNN